MRAYKKNNVDSKFNEMLIFYKKNVYIFKLKWKK